MSTICAIITFSSKSLIFVILSLKAGFKPLFDSPFFNEFAMKAPAGFEKRYDELAKKGFVAGLDLGKYYPEYKGAWLFCATEVHTREEIDAFLKEVA